MRASHGWDLAGEFVDDGVSAADGTLSRPHLHFGRGLRRQGAALVVSKLERLRRSALLLGNFDAHGVAFV